jgi:hypothetical protein
MVELSNRDWAHYYFEEYDLEAQLIAIRSFLRSSRKAGAAQQAEIKALTERAKLARSEHLVGMWTDALHDSVYHDAARSAAAAGMLAPFVENLFTGIFRGISKMGDDVLGNNGNQPRAVRAKALFWDPHTYFERKEIKTDIVAGIRQLADVTGLTPFLPGDAEKVLSALFSYRNQIMHNGFEWPLDRRESFASQRRQWPTKWFSSASSGGKAWVWYMTDVFVERILAFIDEVLEAAGEHIRLNYVPDPGTPASEGTNGA